VVSEIKPGDLVRVARDCCGAHLGLIFEVESIWQPPGWWRITRCCGYIGDEPLAERKDAVDGQLCHAPLSWFRKIPPLGELDDVEHTEEILA
jgi:hypothetical protein